MKFEYNKPFHFVIGFHFSNKIFQVVYFLCRVFLRFVQLFVSVYNEI